MDYRKLESNTRVCFKYFTVKCNNSFLDSEKKFRPYLCAITWAVEKGLKKIKEN